MTIKMEFPQNLLISYDPDADAAYIRIRSGKVARTKEEVPDSINLDLNSRGQLLGIEIFRPAQVKVQYRVFQRLANRFHLPVLKHLHPELLPKVYASA